MTKICRLAALFAFALFFACAQKSDTGPAVAKVNDAPILLKDFQKEVSLAAKRDPMLKITPEGLKQMLDTSIDRKLMIQQAVKMGLSEDEKFLDTIKAYWEQTLIRELIDVKTREWAEKLPATDEEVKRHYDGMKRKLTIKTAYAGNETEAEKLRAALEANKGAEGAKLIEGILIEDVEISDPLYNAFFQAMGEARTYKENAGYVVVQVVKTETIAVPPMKDVYEKISVNLIEQKKKKALEDWIAGIKGSSTIEIDETLLKKAAQ